MEFIINKTQYKIKLPISELITLQLNKPIIQRDIDLEIVQHITDYQIKRFNEKGSFLFVGDLTIAVRGENIYLIDGQHRYYSILTDLYKIDSTYMVSLNYVRVNNNGDNNNLPTLEEVFILLLNKLFILESSSFQSDLLFKLLFNEVTFYQEKKKENKLVLPLISFYIKLLLKFDIKGNYIVRIFHTCLSDPFPFFSFSLSLIGSYDSTRC